MSLCFEAREQMLLELVEGKDVVREGNDTIVKAIIQAVM